MRGKARPADLSERNFDARQIRVAAWACWRAQSARWIRIRPIRECLQIPKSSRSRGRGDDLRNWDPRRARIGFNADFWRLAVGQRLQPQPHSAPLSTSRLGFKPKSGQGQHKAGETGSGEGGRAIERHRAECELVAGRDPGFREQRVVGSEALFPAKESYPVDDDLPDVVADWKEPSRESLCPLGADVTSVVLD